MSTLNSKPIFSTKGVWGHAPPEKVCISKASEEHFPYFLTAMFFKVVNFWH
jgi:hypothetical protein